MRCMVIMPFAESFDPVFDAVKRGIAGAIPSQHIDCHWLKDSLHAGRITDDIVDGLQHSSICIADVTGNNPNVMWETGYAMALGKPAILIAQDVDAIPFDLKVHRVLRYSVQHLTELSSLLGNAVRQTVARYSDVAKSSKPRPFEKRAFSIVATGSSTADPARTRRRIETLLQPYIALDATWYCGTSGIADELLIAHLVAMGKQPIAVGYNALDYTRTARQLIEEHGLPFIDASVESLPKALAGPSERDIFFATKADIAILLWAGRSLGVERLIEYLKANGTNMAIGFV